MWVKHRFRNGFVLVAISFFLWQWFFVDGGLFGNQLLHLRANPGDKERVAALVDLADELVADPALRRAGLELVEEERLPSEVRGDLLEVTENRVNRFYHVDGDPTDLARSVLTAFQADGLEIRQPHCGSSSGGNLSEGDHLSISFRADRHVDGVDTEVWVDVTSLEPFKIGQPMYRPGIAVPLRLRLLLRADSVLINGAIGADLEFPLEGEPCFETVCSEYLDRDCIRAAVWRGTAGLTAIASRIGCHADTLVERKVADTGQDPASVLVALPQVADVIYDYAPNFWLGTDSAGPVAHMHRSEDDFTFEIYTCDHS